jgi:hypothetical protein
MWSIGQPQGIHYDVFVKYSITKPEQKRIVAKLVEIPPLCERLKGAK